MRRIYPSHFLLLLILVSFLFINGCGGASNTLSPAGAVIGNILEGYVYVPARGMEIEAGFKKGAPVGYVPLTGARVTIVGQNKYSLTDSQGYVQLKDVLAGTYSVTVTKEGYRGITYSNVVISDTSITTVGDSRTGVQTQTSSNPAIVDLNNTSGLEDSSLTITGYSFGSVQGTSTVAFYNNKTATVTSWSNTQIVCIVPSGAETGNIKVTVGGNSSNEISFTVLPPNNPVITSLSPSSGNIGDTITITGTGFGSSQGTSTVKFNGVSASMTGSGWGAASIVCTVPATATTGNVVVTVGGNDSNGVRFTVTVTLPGEISSVNPISASRGQTLDVVITGSNTHFSDTISAASFSGTGIMVNSTTVTDATHATANITIATDASITARDVNVTTGAETPTPLSGGFTVLYALRDTGPAGGWICYVDPAGAKLLPAGITYLEAAPSDQSTSQVWSNITNALVGATGTAIGTGQANTTAIIGQAGHTTSAAKLCDDLTVGGYSDWFLPSKDELNTMYVNLKLFGVGGFGSNYWSSEISAYGAWKQFFDTGSQEYYSKFYNGGVRAVRDF